MFAGSIVTANWLRITAPRLQKSLAMSMKWIVGFSSVYRPMTKLPASGAPRTGFTWSTVIA